jgi:predicted transcriptional regulator
VKDKRNRRARPRSEKEQLAVARFVERFALLVTQSGLPRMPARVYVALLTTDAGHLTAAEIAKLLGVSRAAISIAMKYLLHVGLVTRERTPGERVDRYHIDADTWFESFARRDEMLASWQVCVRDGVEALGHDTPAGRRLEETRLFFEFLQEETPHIMQRWRKMRDKMRAKRSR